MVWNRLDRGTNLNRFGDDLHQFLVGMVLMHADAHLWAAVVALMLSVILFYS